jgi:hypothetical protein
LSPLTIQHFIDTFWDTFSDYSRDLFDEICPGLSLPATGTTFDYFIDIKENKFRDWQEIVPKFQYDDHVPYFR